MVRIYARSLLFAQRTRTQALKPNTHRRRDSTRQLTRVGVGGVYWALDDDGTGPTGW